MRIWKKLTAIAIAGVMTMSLVACGNSDTNTSSSGGSGTGLKQVSDGTYPVWGYEHMYTKGEATGAVKAYIDYIMSDEYSGKLEEQGYGVTSKMTVQR